MLMFFLAFVCIPMFLLWKSGFERLTANLLALGFVIVFFLVGSITGFLFECLFVPENPRLYQLPTLFTNAYAERANLGGMLFIPFIFVVDVLWITVHYTFTHSSFVMNIFQLITCYGIFGFLSEYIKGMRKK